MNNVIDLDINNSISMIHFELSTEQVTLGEDLCFTFTLQNTSEQAVRLDIRYEIVYPDRDGNMISRRYKISNRKCPVGFLLYNQNHTLSEDSFIARSKTVISGTSASGETVSKTPAYKSSVSGKSASVIAAGNTASTNACPVSIPCKLCIVINGQQLQSADFQLLLP